MKIVYKKKYGGKTKALIQESAEKQAYIVCCSKKESTKVFHKAKEMGLHIPFPITFTDLIQGNYFPGGIKGFLIDNADLLLATLCRQVPLKGFSLTMDELDSGKERGPLKGGDKGIIE